MVLSTASKPSKTLLQDSISSCLHHNLALSVTVISYSLCPLCPCLGAAHSILLPEVKQEGAALCASNTYPTLLSPPKPYLLRLCGIVMLSGVDVSWNPTMFREPQILHSCSTCCRAVKSSENVFTCLSVHQNWCLSPYIRAHAT